MAKPEQRSFTIIELLVVIAIIGVLASIVLVSLSGTRDRAQIAKTLLYSSQIYHSLGADIVGNWNLDEGSGTTALDSSGYYNTGAISGATYTDDTPHKAAGQGQGKYALSFDGVNDYVDCGNGASLNIVNAITIEGWTKPTGDIGSLLFPTVARKENAYAMRYDNASGQLGGIVWIGGSAKYTSWLANAWDTTKWTHFVFVYDGSYLRLYRDGLEAVTPIAQTGNINSSANKLGIGAEGSGSYFFRGLIDEVRIYSRALTASEIQQHYADGLGKHQNLTIK